MSLETIKSIFVLDSEGKRICAKYYTDEYPTKKEQRKYEKILFGKTHKINSEILLWEKTICVYRSIADVTFYVNGGPRENELMLLSVLNGMWDTLSQLLHGQIDKQILFENLDYLLLLMDEICDSGVIMEADPAVLVPRVSLKVVDSDVPFGDKQLPQAGQELVEHLRQSVTRWIKS